MKRVHLCTGILERDGCVLLVGNRYPNHPELLWGPPGGRQEPGELLDDALQREFDEEVAMPIEIERLAYVAESYDRTGDVHYTNAAFVVRSEASPHIAGIDPHTVDFAWVPVGEVAGRVVVPVVRTPLTAFLAGDRRGYYGFSDAGITIRYYDGA